MNKNTIGKTIKDRRRELKISQETLCSGICNRSALSRIENGEPNVGIDIICQLIDRLGLSSEVIYETEDDYNNKIRQVIRRANQIYVTGNCAEALKLLDTIGDNCENFSLQNKQRYDVINIMLLFKDGRITAETRLYYLEKSMRLTQPKYSLDNLPLVMTDMEAQILKYMATTYGMVEDYEKAIMLYSHLKHHLENDTDKVTSAGKLVSICYNLSKSLGLTGRYDESIAVAEESIRYCEYTDNLSMLPSCIYNNAKALASRNNYGDKEEAKKLAEEALSLCNSRVWNVEELTECLNRLLREINSQ